MAPVGPRRTGSVRRQLRATRVAGVVSVLVLAGAIVWDLADHAFWSRHALFTSLIASFVVVAVTAAVLNELLERRQRERWSVLAQYALFDFVRTARLVWGGLLELAGLAPEGEPSDVTLEAGTEAVRDTPRLSAAIDGLLANAEQREKLHRLIVSAARRRPGGARTLGRRDGQLRRVRRDRRSPRRALQPHLLVGQRAGRVRPARRAPRTGRS